MPLRLAGPKSKTIEEHNHIELKAAAMIAAVYDAPAIQSACNLAPAIKPLKKASRLVIWLDVPGRTN